MADRHQTLMPVAASPRPENWPDQAACHSSTLHADAWFPQEPEERRAKAARAVCQACPVREDCLAHALSRPNTQGIWGGLDERERRLTLRRGRRHA